MKMLNIEFTAGTNGQYHNCIGLSSILNSFEERLLWGFLVLVLFYFLLLFWFSLGFVGVFVVLVL